jgi:hypothetical protein
MPYRTPGDPGKELVPMNRNSPPVCGCPSWAADDSGVPGTILHHPWCDQGENLTPEDLANGIAMWASNGASYPDEAPLAKAIAWAIRHYATRQSADDDTINACIGYAESLASFYEAKGDNKAEAVATALAEGLRSLL